ARQRFDEVEEARIEALACHAPPALVIALPAAGHILGLCRRDEACENGAFRMLRGDLGDDRQRLIDPVARPWAVSREQALHVDAKVKASRAQRRIEEGHYVGYAPGAPRAEPCGGEIVITTSAPSLMAFEAGPMAASNAASRVL